MKTARFFILLGACALLFSVVVSASPQLVRSSWASQIPIVRVDPRAGDPDDPIPSYAIPFDESDYDYVEETSLSSQDAPPVPRRASRVEVLRAMAKRVFYSFWPLRAWGWIE